MIQLYGYNLPETKRNLNSAILFDGDCAMCYWATAYAFSPNINHEVNSDDVAHGLEAISNAYRIILSNRTAHTDLEYDLISAMKVQVSLY